MKRLLFRRRTSILAAIILSVTTLMYAPMGVNAATSTGATTPTTKSTASQATAQQHLQNIIAKGDQEITRRITSLNAALSQLNATTKLSASDKTALVNEINQEIIGLTALKTKLDAETTVSGAITDAQSIFNDYRVYALLLPKGWLIRVADSQTVNEANLTTLSQKIQTRLDAAKASGKDVTALQNELNDMKNNITSANSASVGIEAKILPLQPSDYNSDHSILNGYKTELQLAHDDLKTALSDAQGVVTGLKNL